MMCNWFDLQIDRVPRSHIAPVSCPAVQNSERQCAHFCSRWCKAGCGAGESRDVWNWYMVRKILRALFLHFIQRINTNHTLALSLCKPYCLYFVALWIRFCKIVCSPVSLLLSCMFIISVLLQCSPHILFVCTRSNKKFVFPACTWTKWQRYMPSYWNFYDKSYIYGGLFRTWWKNKLFS